MVKALIRRLCRLEDRFGPAIETDFSRRMHERIKAGRRRVAEMRESLGLSPPEDWPPYDRDDGHLPMIDRIKARLHRGRDRVALAHQSNITASRASVSPIDTNASVSTCVRAADGVPDHSAKAIEIKNIEAAVSTWEASVALDRKGGGR
jgi:hypothetical protein